jgi:TetR/AcrR family transcriptional repressor of nem operon
MSRPRTFALASVVGTAKELFWSRGYEGTALGDVEAATGLNRSSLYQAFGNKEALFRAALDDYVRTFMGELLGPMESPTARPQDVQVFFGKLAARFSGDPAEARKGCLWVNSLAEFSSRRNPPEVHAAGYCARLSNAFHNALSSGGGPVTGGGHAIAQRRSRMLAATTFGLWLAVRIDPGQAAVVCDSVRAEVGSW